MPRRKKRKPNFAEGAAAALGATPKQQRNVETPPPPPSVLGAPSAAAFGATPTQQAHAAEGSHPLGITQPSSGLVAALSDYLTPNKPSTRELAEVAERLGISPHPDIVAGGDPLAAGTRQGIPDQTASDLGSLVSTILKGAAPKLPSLEHPFGVLPGSVPKTPTQPEGPPAQPFGYVPKATLPKVLEDRRRVKRAEEVAVPEQPLGAVPPTPVAQHYAKSKTGYGVPSPKLSKALKHPKAALAAQAKLERASKRVARSGGGDNSVPGQIATVLHNKGYSKVAIAGILGNAYAESNYDPTADDGSGNGGLWGFTAGEVSKANMQKWAAEHGMNWEDPKAQTRFLVEHVSDSTKANVNAASSPEEAATIFMNEFERPGIPRQDVREQAAAEAFGSTAISRPNPKAVKALNAAEAEARKLGINPEKAAVETAAQVAPTWRGEPTGRIKYAAQVTSELRKVHPDMVKLAKTMSAIVGEGPLEIISGFRPGSTLESGAPDAHSQHNALDFGALDQNAGGTPASEAKGNKIATAAAVAGGADVKSQEFKDFIQNGGVYEIENTPNGYKMEIIWKTPDYGGHDDHVHVGIWPTANTVASTAVQKPTPVPKGQRQYFKKTGSDDYLRFAPTFTHALVGLARASGEPIVVNDGFRTYQMQVERKSEYGSGAAEPGTSNHERGLAADLQLSDKQRSLLAQFGLGLPVAGEDWHVELTDPALVAKAEGQVASSVPGVASGSYSGGGSGVGGSEGSPTGGGPTGGTKAGGVGLPPLGQIPLSDLLKVLALEPQVGQGEDEGELEPDIIARILARKNL